MVTSVTDRCDGECSRCDSGLKGCDNGILDATITKIDAIKEIQMQLMQK